MKLRKVKKALAQDDRLGFGANKHYFAALAVIINTINIPIRKLKSLQCFYSGSKKQVNGMIIDSKLQCISKTH